MHTSRNLAAINAAATALAYREHGFIVRINTYEMPAVEAPATASDLTHSLAQLTGTIAEALAMQLSDTDCHRPERNFSEYFTAASYAAMQAPLSHQGISRPAVIDKIRTRIWTQYSSIQALAEQILGSIAARQEVSA